VSSLSVLRKDMQHPFGEAGETKGGNKR
jgi:hypothetical protein